MKTIALLGLLIILGACSSTEQSRYAPEESGFLTDYSMLKEGKSGEAHRVFVADGINWKKYKKIKIEPIVVWAGKDSDILKADKKDLENVLSYLHASLRSELAKKFIIANSAGADTLTLKVAITDGEKSSPVADTLSNLIPVGIALSYVKKAAVGTHLSVGETSVEAELVDSVTNERLIAAMDARAGGKNFDDKFDSWGDLKAAFEYWSAKLNSRLTSLGAGK